MTPLQGLTDQEAAELRRQGHGNDVQPSTSRTYGQILRKNFLILFVRPRFGFLALVNRRTADIKPTLLTGLMVVLLGFVLLVEPLRNFFEFVLLTPRDYLILTGLALLWSILLWFTYRWRLLQRFFTIT